MLSRIGTGSLTSISHLVADINPKRNSNSFRNVTRFIYLWKKYLISTFIFLISFALFWFVQKLLKNATKTYLYWFVGTIFPRTHATFCIKHEFECSLELWNWCACFFLVIWLCYLYLKLHICFSLIRHYLEYIFVWKSTK